MRRFGYIKITNTNKGCISYENVLQNYYFFTVILILGLSGLFTYEYYINKNQPSQNQEEAENTQDNVITSDFESEKKPIVPFTSMTESNGSLYITKSLSSSANLENVNIIPIESDFFTIIGEDVYYITNGSDEFAPELRRCGLDGNNDVSISEFVSPLGSPVVIGDYIYSAYYTDADEGLNNGIYKINIGSGETEKAIEGEYFIYGYDNDKIYYTSNLENRGSGTILHRMNFDGTDKTEVLNFSVRTDSIVVYDKFIYFSQHMTILATATKYTGHLNQEKEILTLIASNVSPTFLT